MKIRHERMAVFLCEEAGKLVNNRNNPRRKFPTQAALPDKASTVNTTDF